MALRAEIRVDNDAETLLGSVPLDKYGVRGEKISFDLISPPQWLTGDTPPVVKLELEWGNFCPDGVTVFPAIKAKANEIDKLRRIPGFIEGARGLQ